MLDNGLFPSPLRESLERRLAVAFVGAGFTMPLGFPNWYGLLENLTTFCAARVRSNEEREKLAACKRQIKAGKLKDAAGALKGLLASADFSIFINEQFNTRKHEQTVASEVRERMERRRHNLTRAPWAGIVTTNFDDYIGMPGFSWRAHGAHPALGHILSHREPFFVKLHSDEWQRDLVLTSEEYLNAYIHGEKTPKLPHFLQALMLSYHLVFIGCSIEHSILEIRQRVSHIFDRMLPMSYALVPKTQENTDSAEKLKHEHQIQLITYKPDMARKPPHSAVDRFLELAAKCRAN